MTKRKGPKMRQKKSVFSSAFKAKVACEALRENKTTIEIASEHGAHPSQINKWKKIIIKEGSTLFEHKNNKKNKSSIDIGELQRIVGEQAIQLAWYKKKLGITN